MAAREAWQTVGHYLEIWRAAREDERRQVAQVAPAGSAGMEFLPAVLEIQSTPPSPVGRAVSWTIMAFVVAGVVWATIGKVDIVAVARGKIIPSGYSKVIQPLESGVIKAIHVRDGQIVKQGEVLIDLDPTTNVADYQKAANEWQSVVVQAARLRALLVGQPTFDPPVGVDPQTVTLHQKLLRDQLAEYRSKVDASRHLIEQRQASVEATKAAIKGLEATIPMQTERAEALKKLLADQYVARSQYLEVEQQRVGMVQDLAAKKEKLSEDLAALAEAKKNYDSFVSQFQQTKQAELADNEIKAASLSQEMVKAQQKTGLQRLTSPIDGVVQQLAVHTVGGVVTPAQALLVVVPQGHQLEVEALVENKDIGFVQEGQPVEIKVETFPFTIYGTINGKILSVSDDAVPLDKDKGGLAYTARVSMERSTIQVENRQVNLSPGMAVTAEIKTGDRRLIEFFLSPLLKSLKESARER
jgi:hemolysin D